MLTAVIGWWGIPWGPVFTVQTLVRNLRGGRQEKSLNAELLHEVGICLRDRGDTPEATRALEESLELRQDPEVARLLAALRGCAEPQSAL